MPIKNTVVACQCKEKCHDGYLQMKLKANFVKPHTLTLYIY